MIVTEDSYSSWNCHFCVYYELMLPPASGGYTVASQAIWNSHPRMWSNSQIQMNTVRSKISNHGQILSNVHKKKHLPYRSNVQVSLSSVSAQQSWWWRTGIWEWLSHQHRLCCCCPAHVLRWLGWVFCLWLCRLCWWQGWWLDLILLPRQRMFDY